MEIRDVSGLVATQNVSLDFSDRGASIGLFKVFGEKKYGEYIDSIATLFFSYFHTIPSQIREDEINCDKALDWLLKTHKEEIRECIYDKSNMGSSTKPSTMSSIYFFLFEDLILEMDFGHETIGLVYKKTDLKKVEELNNDINKFKIKRRITRTPKISLLVNSRSGLDTKSLSITKPKLNIENNYNDDFKEIHQTILKRLSKNDDKGLVLLHGKPGTGKTSYIRYLISSLKKKVIFLPPNMASAITNPELMPVLIDNSNSIFVIEDAENIVVDRETNGASPVSALLNISDGLLSDCLNIQIICSFNIDINKVDNALLRKGRLIARYEFKELETTKAQILSNTLGFDTVINKPMTLTEIYNQHERSFEQSKQANRIGFSSVN